MSCVNYLSSYFYSHQNVIRYMAIHNIMSLFLFQIYLQIMYCIHHLFTLFLVQSEFSASQVHQWLWLSLIIVHEFCSYAAKEWFQIGTQVVPLTFQKYSFLEAPKMWNRESFFFFFFTFLVCSSLLEDPILNYFPHSCSFQVISEQRT